MVLSGSSTTKGSPWMVVAKLLVLALPLLFLVTDYIIDDPFKVIRRYDFGDYYDDQVYELNRDYVSTEMFFSRYPQARFDTFIFGSSRSFSYYCDELRSCLPGSRPFHYPAASENLYGIYRKIRMLDEFGVDLKNVLIVIDGPALADISSRPDHLHILHPRLSGEGWRRFELAFLRAFLSPEFLCQYLYHRFSGRFLPSTKRILIPKGDIRIDPMTNDYYFEREERLLRKDENAFFREREPLFPVRDAARESTAKPGLTMAHESLLREIEAIFRRHQTNLRIVISPLYDQVALNPKDRETLESIFGKANVFDFSGANRITEDMHNFYDPGHYRPFIAAAIMRQVFAPPETKDQAPPGQRSD